MIEIHDLIVVEMHVVEHNPTYARRRRRRRRLLMFYHMLLSKWIQSPIRKIHV